MALIIIPSTLFSQDIAAPFQNIVLRAQTHMDRLALDGIMIKARARIILLASRDVGVRATADELGIGRSTVQAWRRRWTENSDASVAERLSDAPRPGTPPIFTAEQSCAVVTLACEDPRESGRSITHLTQWEVADEAMKQGVVPSISSRSIGRFFKISGHQTTSQS